MIQVTNLDLIFSDKKLFEGVNLKFTKGNTYGIIGANGAGKSTFLRIISGDILPSKGEIIIQKKARLAVLKQDHFEYDDFKVLDTVIMGHKRLYEIIKQKEELYAKTDFTEEDGIRAGNLEAEFAELDGWNAEYEAELILQGLGVETANYQKQMREIKGKNKVKVLLAQALFGQPDILVLDEPTNHLDFEAIRWLEDFLINFENTVLVVSHDRHFLNKVCTHMADIDYNEIKIYPGNYDFWYESSQLMRQMMLDSNKRKEEKIKELETFIARFSANASKSKQATSRKKSLEKIQLDEIRPSNRRYPYISFEVEKRTGKEMLEVTDLTVERNGEKILDNVSFKIVPFDKLFIHGNDDLAKTVLMQVLAGEITDYTGTVKWGSSVDKAYLPVDNSEYFNEVNSNLVEWLCDLAGLDDEAFVRSFLGRMLFSRQEPLKKVKVLSGGEKMRCMFSKVMMAKANTLLLDQPTNHLDLESIQSLNDGLVKYQGTLIFTSHDHSIVSTVANKVLEIENGKATIHYETFDDFIARKEQSKK